MERIVHKTKNFKDAEKYNINQNISMSPEQRQAAAKKIKERVYGKSNPDIREYHKLGGK